MLTGRLGACPALAAGLERRLSVWRILRPILADFGPDVVNHGDVRMIQRRGSPGLLLEARQALRGCDVRCIHKCAGTRTSARTFAS